MVIEIDQATYSHTRKLVIAAIAASLLLGIAIGALLDAFRGGHDFVVQAHSGIINFIDQSGRTQFRVRIDSVGTAQIEYLNGLGQVERRVRLDGENQSAKVP